HPRETVELLSHYHPSNIPGKSLITLLVTLPPNAATPPHTHSNAAISASMIQGTALNQMNCSKPFISSVGESFYEAPGCHHVRSENTSKTENAKFSVVMIVDDEVVKDGYEMLAVLDAEVEEKRQAEPNAVVG
ncbi:hypothetical protein MMC28_011715, partial [Mycoblastus sanguinarius]|nr:hypothetical protein [Mycoblastus sanguinarius]